MINKIKAMRNKYMNKKGASMMEFFVITLVVLLIGAAVFVVGKVMKNGMDEVEDTAGSMTQTMTGNTNSFDNFNSKVSNGSTAE